MSVLAPDRTEEQTAPGGGRVHRLAAGTELLGEFQDGGYQTAKYLVRRGDGQLMQLPHLLYRLAGALDGEHSVDDIAQDLSRETGQQLTAEQVAFLIDERLGPVGLLAADGEAGDPDAPPAAAPPTRSDPLLALRYRVGVVPAAVSWRIAGVLRPLFHRPVWLAGLAAFVLADVLVAVQGDLPGRLLGGLGDMVARPVLSLFVFGSLILAMAFHECGHATACRYGGARPGEMGVGLYLVWPAFYCSVTDAYRLDRAGRLRTDLGGVYFNALVMAVLAVAYLRTGDSWLLVALLLLHVETAWQFLPSIRFDGYYMLSDLVGVPELFNFVGPVLAGFLPGRGEHPLVRELRTASRRVIAVWVAVTVPVLLFWLVAFFLLVPRAVPVVAQEVARYWGTVQAAVHQGDVVALVLSLLQVLLMVLPWLGTVLIVVTVASQLRRLAARRAGWSWGGAGTGRAVRRYGAAALVGAVAVGLVWRLAQVAGAAPPTDVESGLVSGPGAPAAADAVLRAQLAAFTRVSRALGDPAGALGSARQLALVAATALVVGFLVAARALRWRPAALLLPLAAVAAMGPTMVLLAHLSAGLLGAAWLALGVACLLVAVRGTGRHRQRPRRTAPRVLAGVGCLFLLAGVATQPLLCVPLAVVAALLVHAAGGRPTRPAWWSALVVLALALTAVAGLSAPALLGRAAPAGLLLAERRVLLVIAVLLVAVGALHRPVRAVSVATAAAVGLAALPLPGADGLLPAVVFLGCLIAGLVVDGWVRRPVAERPHPLLRAAVAVPLLVLVVAGALYAPPSPATALAGPQPVAGAHAAVVHPAGPVAGG